MLDSRTAIAQDLVGALWSCSRIAGRRRCSVCRTPLAATTTQRRLSHVAWTGGGDTRLVKLSNILNIETRPFDPAAYEPAEEEAIVDESGKRRVRLRDQNVIRWRVRPGPDGVPAIESNAR